MQQPFSHRVGDELVKGLRSGAKYLTLEEMDLIRALAEAYERGLKKGEALERAACADIVIKSARCLAHSNRREVADLFYEPR